MSTFQQFILTVENPYSSEISARNNILTQLSHEDLVLIRNQAVENRLWNEDKKDCFFQVDKDKLVNKFVKRRFWLKPWTWLKKNKIIKPSREEIQKVEESQQYRLRKIDSLKLIEYLCNLYLSNKTKEFESKVFRCLDDLDDETRKKFQFTIWFSTNSHRVSSIDNNYRHLFLLESISKKLLELQPLEYWITN